MTMEQKITLLHDLMGEDDDTPETVLSVYLDLAKHKILNRMYPFRTDYGYDDTDVPDRYVAIQLNIAVYLLNKRGAEGEIQHIENGIHRNYGSSDVPDGMLKDIVPYAQAIR